MEIDVPLGEYEMRYATGTIWYGEADLFGSKTTYSKAEEFFEFTQEGDYVYGYTVELYHQSSGNLETNNINESEF